MDKRTERELRKVTMGIPTGLQSVTHEVIDLSEEDVVREALRDARLPSGTRHRLKIALERGDFRKTDTVIDDAKVLELDRYHAAMIDKLKRQGKLTDPRNDAWLQKRLQRMRK